MLFNSMPESRYSKIDRSNPFYSIHSVQSTLTNPIWLTRAVQSILFRHSFLSTLHNSLYLIQLAGNASIRQCHIVDQCGIGYRPYSRSAEESPACSCNLHVITWSLAHGRIMWTKWSSEMRMSLLCFQDFNFPS